jgi:Myb-like DNA-binding domain
MYLENFVVVDMSDWRDLKFGVCARTSLASAANVDREADAILTLPLPFPDKSGTMPSTKRPFKILEDDDEYLELLEYERLGAGVSAPRETLRLLGLDNPTTNVSTDNDEPLEADDDDGCGAVSKETLRLLGLDSPVTNVSTDNDEPLEDDEPDDDETYETSDDDEVLVDDEHRPANTRCAPKILCFKETLLEAVERHESKENPPKEGKPDQYEKDWDNMANLIKTRDIAQIQAFYEEEDQKSPLAPTGFPRSTPRSTGNWTQFEKDRYQEGLAEFGPHFGKIATFIGSRSISQVITHFYSYRSTDHNRGKWTDIESGLFQQAIVLYGIEDHASIANFIKTRSREQVRHYIQNQARVKRGYHPTQLWTDDEKAIFNDAVRRYGNDPRAIASALKTRDEHQVKFRIKWLLREPSPKQEPSPHYNKGMWADDENKRYYDAVEEFGPYHERAALDKLVAERVKTRSQAQVRYKRKNAIKRSKITPKNVAIPLYVNKWSPDEEFRLVALIETTPLDSQKQYQWTKIAQSFPGRDASQIRPNNPAQTIQLLFAT